MNLVYRIDTSSQNDILSHLKRCDKEFIAHLSQRTSLEDYSAKLFARAMRFETWHNDALVGLIAIYINENNFAFITNVSVAEDYTGKKIASHLLDKCIAFAKEQKIEKLKLEVHPENMPAIKFYEKYNFKNTKVNETTRFMELVV